MRMLAVTWAYAVMRRVNGVQRNAIIGGRRLFEGLSGWLAYIPLCHLYRPKIRVTVAQGATYSVQNSNLRNDQTERLTYGTPPAKKGAEPQGAGDGGRCYSGDRSGHLVPHGFRPEKRGSERRYQHDHSRFG